MFDMDQSYLRAPTYPDALSILGLPLHPVDIPKLHGYMEAVIRNRQKAMVLNLNINAANIALKYQWFRDLYDEAQLVFCDSDGVRWGLELLSRPAAPKITYDRYIWDLACFCCTAGYRLYFLGAKPGVAQTAADCLCREYPQLRVAGVQHGYFDKNGRENDAVVAHINQSRTDVLVIGFGMPLQEQWLAANWAQLHIHIAMTGGAVFDYAAGNFKRAPDWMIENRLEWLYRFTQDPVRLFRRYVLGNPLFMYRVWREARGAATCRH